MGVSALASFAGLTSLRTLVVRDPVDDENGDPDDDWITGLSGSALVATVESVVLEGVDGAKRLGRLIAERCSGADFPRCATSWCADGRSRNWRRSRVDLRP